MWIDRHNADPVMSGTSDGAQGRSSWEGGAEGAHRRHKEKKNTQSGSFFFLWFPLRSRCFIRKWVSPTFPDLKGISIVLYSLSQK